MVSHYQPQCEGFSISGSILSVTDEFFLLQLPNNFYCSFMGRKLGEKMEYTPFPEWRSVKSLAGNNSKAGRCMNTTSVTPSNTFRYGT